MINISRKKVFAILSVCAVFALPLSAKQKSIKPGEIWPDDKGVHINAHGGGLLYKDGTYYWFGEHKGQGVAAALVGVTCYSSKDLYNWKNRGVALSVTQNPGDDIESGCTLERPKVVYNKKTGKYVMVFHLELKGQGYKAARAGFAVSDKPEGPYRFIRSLRPNPGVWPENMTKEQRESKVESTDFEKAWTPEWMNGIKDGMLVRRDFPGGQMSRDMTVYVDDDGKAYHIYSSEENLTLQIAELTDDYLGYTGRYIRVHPGGHNEAPAIFKKDGVYYMITSGCTGWAPNAARLSSAKSMFGPWTEFPNPCVGKEADLTFRSQSTYIQKVEGLKDAYIYMGDRWTPKDSVFGTYIWLPILFENGKPVLKWFDEWNMDIFKANK